MRTQLFPAALGLGAMVVAIFPLALAAPPELLNHQGRILVQGANFGAPTPATGYFKFALVTSGAAETIWTNDDTNEGTPGGEPIAAVPITVSNGLYSVGLGDTALPNMTALPTSALSDHRDVHLRIWFSSDNSSYELLAPDQRLVSTAYALNAGSLSLPAGAALGHLLTSDSLGRAFWAPPLPGPPGTDTLAGLGCEAGQIAVFNGEEWVCQDFPGFQWAPARQPADTFQVALVDGPDFAAGDWREALEGGLTLNPPNSSIWENLELTGPVRPRSALQPVALTTRDFDVDSLFGPDTVRIQGISVRFPKVETSPGPGATPKHKLFRPGAPTFGNVTITGRRGGNSSAVREWVKDTYDGVDRRKDVTIRLRRSPADPPEVTLILHDCRPLTWRLITRTPGTDPLNPTTGLEAIVIEPVRIEIVSHSPKPPLRDWYEDMLEDSIPSNVQRDLVLTYLDQAGEARDAIDYHDCFLTAYTLDPLSAEESGVECEETIEIAVGYSDDFLVP